MSLGDGKVCGIVSRGDFEHSRSKLHIHMLIPDDGDESLAFGKLWREGSDGLLTDQSCITRIFRIYSNRRISRDSFRACRRDR